MNLTVRLWMEILRIVDREPGITVLGVTRNLRRGTMPGVHRLQVTGYIRMMMDMGMLQRTEHSYGLRCDGVSFANFMEDYIVVQEQLKKKHASRGKQRVLVAKQARDYYEEWEADEG